MNEEQIIQEMVDLLEANEEIRITNGAKEITIQSIDDKEGYSYVSSTNEEFNDCKEAIEWAVEYFKGVEKIEEYE